MLVILIFFVDASFVIDSDIESKAEFLPDHSVTHDENFEHEDFRFALLRAVISELSRLVFSKDVFRVRLVLFDWLGGLE